MVTRKAHRFVVCVLNDGYEASLDVRKIYEVVSDPDAEQHEQLRVIDESGEDYLYPREYFRPIELAEDVQVALQQHAAKAATGLGRDRG